MRLPILFDLDNNRIILEKIKVDEDSNDYVDVLGYCQFEDNSKFIALFENADSILERNRLHTFKTLADPISTDEAFNLEELEEFEFDTLKQLRTMLDKCPVKTSFIASTLREQISTVEKSLVPEYNAAERIILDALFNSNYIYDYILNDVIKVTSISVDDVEKTKRGTLVIRTADKCWLEYLVIDKCSNGYLSYQYRRITDFRCQDKPYRSDYFKQTLVKLDDIEYYVCDVPEKYIENIRSLDNIPVKLNDDNTIEIGYKTNIEKFKSECKDLELRNGCIYRAEFDGRSALIEFNGNWRSEKRYNVILFTDDFSLVYPKKSSIVLKPENLKRSANDYEYSALNAIVKEFTAQTKSGNREDGYEKFGKTDDAVVPVMGCSGHCSRTIEKDYTENYAESMERFKKFREKLRSGDVLEVTLTHSRGSGVLYIRYSDEHYEGEPENWFHFDAMQTNDVITTFFTMKEKPVVVVSYASMNKNNNYTLSSINDFKKKVFKLEEEAFEPENNEEKELFELHKKIAEETESPNSGYVVLR